MPTRLPAAGAPSGQPDLAAPAVLRGKERAENFPIALRLLPRAVRADLRSVYDVVRTIDDLGDEAAGDRTAGLERFAEDLHRVWTADAPRSPVLIALVPTVRRHSLPHDPFDRLVRANLLDQRVDRYETFADLLDYCALSAAPIGELVLRIFGQGSPERIELSDRVCAALQVAEHLQDVGEDRRRGRVYLPQQDLAAHGVREADLDSAAAPPALRRLVAAEADRVRELLTAGPVLVGRLSGWARLAVAGYVAGGHAALDGLRRADLDVLAPSPGVRRRDVARHLAGTLLAARGAQPC